MVPTALHALHVSIFSGGTCIVMVNRQKARDGLQLKCGSETLNVVSEPGGGSMHCRAGLLTCTYSCQWAYTRVLTSPKQRLTIIYDLLQFHVGSRSHYLEGFLLTENLVCEERLRHIPFMNCNRSNWSLWCVRSYRFSGLYPGLCTVHWIMQY